jgi:hypothetical protein
VTHRCAIAGVGLLGLALVGVSIVVFSAVSGTHVGWVAGACAAVAMFALWIALPMGFRLNDDNSPGQH